MHTHTTTTATGTEIVVHCWKGSRLNYSVYIDGTPFDSGSSDDDFGRSNEKLEAEFQALVTEFQIESGEIVSRDGQWMLA